MCMQAVQELLVGNAAVVVVGIRVLFADIVTVVVVQVLFVDNVVVVVVAAQVLFADNAAVVVVVVTHLVVVAEQFSYYWGQS